jgi:hypothetical protein
MEATVQQAYAPATDSPASYTLERAAPADSTPVAELVTRLSKDASRLIQQEVALAKLELSEKASELKVQASSVALGGVILHTGALTLTAGLVLLIAQLVAAWIAALFIGTALASLGAVLLLRGKSKLSALSLRPDEAIGSVKRDVQSIQEAIHER